MLTDGHSLDGFVHRIDGYFGDKGTTIEPKPGETDFLWTYALAYRLTGDERCWEMARHLARGNELGDIGALNGEGCNMNVDTDSACYRAIYGLLDLYWATERESYLETATRVAENLLEERYRDGLFVTDDRVGLIGDHAPLALLHLAATNRGQDPETVPTAGGGL